MRTIIGISGKRGTGKSTSAQYLAREHGFEIVSFANRLRELARCFFPFTYDELMGAKKEEPYRDYSWSPREYLIKLGQFQRYWDEAYWVNTAFSGVSKKANIVIDDLRFKNEAKYLVENNAMLIRIERYKSHNPFKGDIHDPSETDLDDYKDFNYKINEVENRSLDALYTRLDHIMEDIKEHGKE